MGAVMVQDLHDLRNPERAGRCKVACYKPDLIDLEAYGESYGDRAQGATRRDRLKRSGCESISDSRILRGNRKRLAEMTSPINYIVVS